MSETEAGAEMSFEKGENVGPYRIIEKLGQGGMATVYKAFHPALDRDVAIKALHPAFMEDPGFLKRFDREAKAVAKLDHPNIVPIYDYASHGGRPYLVIKFIDGETLKARLEKESLSKDEALRIIDAVGEALSYAHKKDYLHRDIKPSNILLGSDGSIYLADFGLARIASAGASTISGDMIMGTPHYISPEQARGELKLDAGTDIYSFGVILYELIVGRVPFMADTPFSIIHDHIYTPLPLPSTVNPNVPESVQRVLLKALAKERKDRFASVKDMVAAIHTAIGRGDIGVLTTDYVPRSDFVAPAAARESVSPVAVPPSVEPQTVPDVAAVPETTPAPQLIAKSRRRWLWAIGGLVLACIVVLSFLAVLDRAKDELKLAPKDVPREEAPNFIGPREDARFKEIDERFRRVDKLLAVEEFAEAFKEIVIIGDIYLELREFVPAIKAYIWASEISERPIQEQQVLINSMTQMFFFGAIEDEMWEYMERFSEMFPEWEALQVAMARSRMLHGFPEEAMVRLEEVLTRSPDDLLALAVLAEFHLMHGNFDEGLRIIEKLRTEDRLPWWLNEHLDYLQP